MNKLRDYLDELANNVMDDAGNGIVPIDEKMRLVLRRLSVDLEERFDDFISDIEERCNPDEADWEKNKEKVITETLATLKEDLFDEDD